MKTTYQNSVPFRIKLFAWLNIAVQMAFPLAAAFTPAMAGAVSDNAEGHGGQRGDRGSGLADGGRGAGGERGAEKGPQLARAG